VDQARDAELLSRLPHGSPSRSAGCYPRSADARRSHALPPGRHSSRRRRTAPRHALAKLWGGEREAYVTTELAKPTLESLALAERNHRAWAGPIVGRVHAARFLRGFVEWIVVDAAVFARDYETLLALAPIRHLDVANIGAAATQFFACPGLAQIVALSFDLGGTPQEHPARDAVVAPLLASPHLRKLRYLDLRRNDLSEAAHAKLAHATNLPALEVLRLDGLEEEYGMDYDGSIQTVRPSAALVAFEQRHGPSAWLHHGERTQREITRTSF